MPGPFCTGTEQLINGTCQFVCQRDGDCGDAEMCDLFTGMCVPANPPVDAGPTMDECTTGAIRCKADKSGIESCGDAGMWSTTQTCPPPNGFCLNEKCLQCQPGVATCEAITPATTLDVCKDDGSGLLMVVCSGDALCTSNECRECTPNTYRCSPDNTAVQQCQKTADQSKSWAWTNVGDNFDGTCITGMCQIGGANGYQCVAPACFPGQIDCKDSVTAETCGMSGAWVDTACVGSATCEGGVCIDECATAVAANSYFGCDYWTGVMDNSVDPLFKGGVMSGQGRQWAMTRSSRSSSPTAR